MINSLKQCKHVNRLSNLDWCWYDFEIFWINKKILMFIGGNRGEGFKMPRTGKFEVIYIARFSHIVFFGLDELKWDVNNVHVSAFALKGESDKIICTNGMHLQENCIMMNNNNYNYNPNCTYCYQPRYIYFITNDTVGDICSNWKIKIDFK